MRKLLGQLVGTCLGIGHVPVVPATWTSLFVAIVFLLVPEQGWVQQLVCLLLVVALGVPACSWLEQRYGHDPKQATADEVAGMLLALFAVPPTWPHVAAAFVLFRVFDVLKLPPARQAERLPGGLGIMADDLVADLQTRIAMVVVLWVFARAS
jgi:phosphatidylglycerophosphatase A